LPCCSITQELNDIIGQKNLYSNDASSNLSDRLSFSGHPSRLSSGNHSLNFTSAALDTTAGGVSNSSSGGGLNHHRGGTSRAPVRNLGMESGDASPVLLTDTSSAGADSDNHRRSPSSNSSPSSSNSNNNHSGRQANGGAGTPDDDEDGGEGGKRKKGSALRRGKWTLEEENYANRLIAEFKVIKHRMSGNLVPRRFFSLAAADQHPTQKVQKRSLHTPWQFCCGIY